MVGFIILTSMAQEAEKSNRNQALYPLYLEFAGFISVGHELPLMSIPMYGNQARVGVGYEGYG